MSDLISRSELLKRFLVNKDGHRIPERDCDNFEVTVSIKDVKTIIKEQPTAYDIDKVVEELEKSSKWINETNGYCDDGNDYIPLSKAIEIVKNGCVSDDACEWTLDGVYLNSPHKPLVSCVTDENYRYYYCPVCGKKIKAV